MNALRWLRRTVKNNWWVQATWKQRLLMAAAGAVILAIIMAGCLGTGEGSVHVIAWTNDADRTLTGILVTNYDGESSHDQTKWEMAARSSDDSPLIDPADCQKKEGNVRIDVGVYTQSSTLVEEVTRRPSSCNVNVEVYVGPGGDVSLDVTNP